MKYSPEILASALEILKIRKEDFLLAVTFIHDAQKALDDGKEFTQEEAEMAFFFGQMFLLVLFRSSPHAKALAVEKKGEVHKLTAGVALVYNTLSGKSSSIDYNTTTSSMYMLMGLPLPLYSKKEDIEKRMVFLERFMGKELLMEHVTQHRDIFTSSINVTLREGVLQSTLDEVGISMDAYTKACECFLDITAGVFDETMIKDALYPTFLPYLYAHKFPNESLKRFQKNAFLVQGNLDNLCFLVFSEILEMNKNSEISLGSSEREQYMDTNLKAVSILYGVESHYKGCTGSTYLEELFALLREHFGKDMVQEALDTVTRAAGSMRS